MTPAHERKPTKAELQQLFAQPGDELTAFKVDAYRYADTQMLRELEQLERTLRDAIDDFEKYKPTHS